MPTFHDYCESAPGRLFPLSELVFFPHISFHKETGGHMRLIASILLLFCNTLSAQGINERPAYLNPDLPIEARVNDLVSRMTLEEKVSQMVNNAKAIPRLQIPEYNWWNECLHGVARSGNATVFPQAIGLAATWNTDLMFRIADVISTEARAKYNDFIRKGERDLFKGLTFWSPNINIFRDPRWGRGQETYGEDPYLTSRMGVAFVRGLQGDDQRYFKVIATPKHFAVHSGPEPERHTFNAVIDDRDLYETYLPAFEACVKEAGAYSVMCAYNSYMGEACCGSNKLLKQILRDEWGFKGYVVSDCGAIDDIFASHKIVETAPEAAALAVKSGTDLNCGTTYDSALIDAVKNGFLSEKEIDVSVKRLFTARFKLGMFDPPGLVQYARIPIGENDSKEHRELALRAAQESIVLLKNADSTLPLRKDLKRIAVIGPTADSYFMLLGNYNGTPSSYVTPLQGIQNKIGRNAEVVYDPGCDLIKEGAVVHYASSKILTVNGNPGLKAEYFKNRDLQGEPFFTRVDPLVSPNWIWGARVPSFRGAFELASIRWSGTLTAPSSGEYDFIVKADGGFRLFVDDMVILADSAAHDLVTKDTHIRLQKGKSYGFKLEFVQNTRRPQLFVQWKLLGVDHFKKAIELAKSSDIVIFVGGITAQLEGEEMRVDYDGFKGGDRTNLKLPRVQEDLLESLYTTGTPIVLVLTSGSALAVNWENEHVPAILQLWYPGEEGGTALADVLFGDYNPAGRLPVTFYKSVDQLPPFEDYNMKGRTYRYFEGEPLYPFGYGLSYAKFKYQNLSVPREVRAGEAAKISVEVQNVGKSPGDEVVQLYVKALKASTRVAIRSLEGFKRIHLKPGEKKVVEFRLEPKQLSVFNSRRGNRIAKYVVEPGPFEIAVGGVQPGAKVPTTESVTKEMKVVGEPYLIRD
jgi:beta-glucosidase